MPADGISLPTTLSQMGNVAKAQAKGQQSAQQVAPFNEQQEKKDDLKVQRVKETKKTDQEKVDPDKENPDKRKRRRMRRNSKMLGLDEEGAGAEDQETGDQGEDELDPETLGLTIDLRV